MDFRNILVVSAAICSCSTASFAETAAETFAVASITEAAEKDAKARDILDAVSDKYNKDGGIEISFGGSVSGHIALKGDMFVLDCGGVKSWFDGTTQWSYVEDNQEVNISCPTPEELQAVNPYALLGIYKKGFDYKYAGKKNRNGKVCDEVVLTPESGNTDLKSITVSVNSKSEPVYIELKNKADESQVFVINKYQVNKNLSDSHFKFDKDLYPDADIIDLR